jgi:hypothetical protein
MHKRPGLPVTRRARGFCLTVQLFARKQLKVPDCLPVADKAAALYRTMNRYARVKTAQVRRIRRMHRPAPDTGTVLASS